MLILINYSALPDHIITALSIYLYISYMLSFQAAEMKEKAQLTTGESRNLNIPVKLKNKYRIMYCDLDTYQDIE